MARGLTAKSPPQKVIQVENQFYILAGSARADDRTHVLKHGETFAVFDRYGDMEAGAQSPHGVFHEGTRFLSRWTLTLFGERPLLLNSTVHKDNILLAVDLTNPDVAGPDGKTVPRGVVHCFRSKFLWEGVCHERLRIGNYGLSPVQVEFAFDFDADFADIFEVRGMPRAARGGRRPDATNERSVDLEYEGLDGRVRRAVVEFSQAPEALSAGRAEFRVRLEPQTETLFFASVSCRSGSLAAPAGLDRADLAYDEAFVKALDAMKRMREECGEVQTSSEPFNDWVRTSVADLNMMLTETPTGPYPYAGVPWFSAPFGRDGILTALECLTVLPSMARGVLGFLALAQARDNRPDQDAEPGKILHETRQGEMAALGEIPFGRYYGSADATPLFVILAGAYFERTGDMDFVRTLWPHVEAALRWMDEFGDRDGDGFVEYFPRSPQGLVHQGWKDSNDAVFHADGALAQGPIALCEVQAYVYAAKRRAADLAAALGNASRAADLRDQARRLRDRFDAAFWCEELGTYALALDGRKQPCRVKTSNAGHALWAGVAGPERARRVADALLAEDSFSGWGVRTVASSQARFNPMSYHNGSIWPHDNALIAGGLARYGFKAQALRIFAGLFEASLSVTLHRLPELFCGFGRRVGEGPTPYPVACSPQAWSSGSVFLLLDACLGLTIDAGQNRITFVHPVLPPFLQHVQIRDLRVGRARVDLAFHRHHDDVGMNVLRREGAVEIVVIK